MEHQWKNSEGISGKMLKKIPKQYPGRNQWVYPRKKFWGNPWWNPGKIFKIISGKIPEKNPLKNSWGIPEGNSEGILKKILKESLVELFGNTSTRILSEIPGKNPGRNPHRFEPERNLGDLRTLTVWGNLRSIDQRWNVSIRSNLAYFGPDNDLNKSLILNWKTYR